MSMRFCNYNLVDQSIINDETYSSEMTNFPGVNTRLVYPRTKVWRTAGYFNVTSSNNSIVFNHGGGNFTASIAVGKYATASSLAAAVEAALESASSSATYTVTHNGNKFVIVRSTGTLNILWTNVGTTAESLLGFVFDDTGALTYTSDVIAINDGTEFVTWDLGAEYNPKVFVMCFGMNTPSHLSPTAVVTLQGNETDSWTAPSYSQVVDLSSELGFLQSDDGLHTEALRYWRLKLVDQNPLGYLELSKLYLGDYLELTEGKASFPLDIDHLDRSITVYSEGGQSYSDVKAKLNRFSVEFQYASIADVEAFKELWDEFGTSKPMFMIFDKCENFSSDEKKMVRLVKFADSVRTRLVLPQKFFITAEFLEEL